MSIQRPQTVKTLDLVRAAKEIGRRCRDAGGSVAQTVGEHIHDSIVAELRHRATAALKLVEV